VGLERQAAELPDALPSLRTPDSSRNRGEGTEHNVTPHQDLRTSAAWSQGRAAAGTSQRPSATCPGSVRRRWSPAFRGSAVSPQRAGIPQLPADTATSEEAEQAAGIARLVTVIGKPLPFFSQDRSYGSSAENPRHGIVPAMLPVFADPPRHNKLVMPERAGSSSTAWRTVDLPEIRKASDNSSDNDPRQHQTQCDALRH
jgi:hypothetical protein